MKLITLVTDDPPIQSLSITTQAESQPILMGLPHREDGTHNVCKIPKWEDKCYSM